MDFNQIGFFQFDNLIQNRVPFILINLGVDLSHIYKGFVALHLQNVMINCTADEAVARVQEKKVPAQVSVVVIDKDGSEAPRVAAAIEKAGTMNSYYVKGGLAGIEQERAADK